MWSIYEGFSFRITKNRMVRFSSGTTTRTGFDTFGLSRFLTYDIEAIGVRTNAGARAKSLGLLCLIVLSQ